MSSVNLNIGQFSADSITSLFLFGAITPQADLYSRVRSVNEPNIMVEIDEADYLSTAGRFARPSAATMSSPNFLYQ